MGKKKPEKIGKIQCGLCKQYHLYINTAHLRTAHQMEFEDYGQTIAEEHGYAPDQQPFADDTLHTANKWYQYDGDVELDIEIKRE